MSDDGENKVIKGKKKKKKDRNFLHELTAYLIWAKVGEKCVLLKDHNAVRLEPMAPRSRVKNSTTELPICCCFSVFVIVFSPDFVLLFASFMITNKQFYC